MFNISRWFVPNLCWESLVHAMHEIWRSVVRGSFADGCFECIKLWIVTLAVNQAVFVVIRRLQKLLYKKAPVLTTWRLRKCTFLNSFKTELAELACVDFGKSEFLNIHIFNRYKAFYLPCRTIFRHLDFIRATGITSCSFQHGTFVRWVAISSYKLGILSSVSHFCLDKKIKIIDMKFTRIRLLLWNE